MNKIILFLCTLLIGATGFADTLILDNQTSPPKITQKSKIMIQWANSVKEVDESNKAILNGSKLNANKLQALTQSGKVQITIPKQSEYFRVLIWSKGEGEPDLVTNWVDIVPNKTYKLENDHLVPCVLMAGTGC